MHEYFYGQYIETRSTLKVLFLLSVVPQAWL